MAITKNAEKAQEKAAPAAKAPAAKAPGKKLEIKAKAAEPEAKAAEPEAAETKVATGKVGRKELAQALHDKVKEQKKAIPLPLAELTIQLLEDAITEALAAGNEVTLNKLGKFTIVAKEATERPNPQKPGEKVAVPAHNSPKFKASSTLKKAVNGGAEAEGDE